MPAGIENCVKYCKESGINSIEFRSGPDLEAFLGAPQMLRLSPPSQVADSGQPTSVSAPPTEILRKMTPEQQQAIIDQFNADLKAWRIAVTPEKVAGAKKMFDDAGIEVHIVKFTPGRWSDEEIDYAFRAAKAMSAKGVSEEISEVAVRKMAPYSEKYGMYTIIHNHAQFAEEGFSVDPFLAVSPSVMLNFDVGHYYGTTGLNPCDFIRKYHDRIFSLHFKDKTGPKTDPPNRELVWGQGETPLAEILLLIKKRLAYLCRY